MPDEPDTSPSEELPQDQPEIQPDIVSTTVMVDTSSDDNAAITNAIARIEAQITAINERIAALETLDDEETDDDTAESNDNATRTTPEEPLRDDGTSRQRDERPEITHWLFRPFRRKEG